MSLNFCDLLVLGSDLSGVMAATLLAKRGLNVLVLDEEEEDSPLPNLVTGLDSKSFRSLLGKLMIPDTKLQVLKENKVSCQIVLPKNRLNLSTSRPDFLKEIDREFPEEKAALEELLSQIDLLRQNYQEEILSFFPIVIDKEKKRFVKWFQTLQDEKLFSLWENLSPNLKTVLRAQLRFFSRSPLVDPPLLQMLFFLPPEGASSFSIKGGMSELKKMFFDKLDYFGGMVHPLGTEPYQIAAKGKEVRSVQLGRYNFPTRCRYLLGNTNIQSLYHRLPVPLISTIFGGMKKKVASLERKEERRLVQYYVTRDRLPEPMRENLIYISDPAQPLEGVNYLEINLNALPKAPINGFDTLMTVSYLLPAQEVLSETISMENPKVYDEIRKRLNRLLPFSENHLQQAYPADPEIKNTQEPELFDTNPASEKMDLLHSQTIFTPSLFFPTLTSPFKNVVTLGPNVLNWLGMEGKMLSALRAVDLIWSQESKIKNP